MIDRNTQCQLAWIGFVQPQQPSLHAFAHHRAHRIGQDQNIITAHQGLFCDINHLRVHKRFTTSKGDLFDAPIANLKLIQIIYHFVPGDIDKRIIGGARGNIAICTFNIAQCSGIKPQGLRVA